MLIFQGLRKLTAIAVIVHMIGASRALVEKAILSNLIRKAPHVFIEIIKVVPLFS